MNDFFWPEKPSRLAFSVANTGYPFIGASAFATVVFALLELTGLALFSLILTFFICYFFRDPERVIPSNPGTIVSPADGRIVSVKTITGSRFFDGTCIKVSIFMSIFNVHVNRIPYEGEVKKIEYYPGKFFSANLDKASGYNEHNAIFLEMENGKCICLVQIAGLIARRIVCYAQSGQRVVRGQRFGIICFGSRVDLYLPEDIVPKVSIGDKVKAGTSVIGYFS